MKVSQKIQLLSLLPLIVSMVAVAYVTEFQFKKLSEDTAEAYRSGLISVRKQELQNYTELALSSINHIYQDMNLPNAQAKEQVAAILSDLSFGEDGYFFAYNQSGDGVVHPKQAFRIGENWWDLQDKSGQFIIRELITNAQYGGDYLEYVWEKPSSNIVAKKLAYSVMLDRWQWMLGTGVYIDDIDREVEFIRSKTDATIQSSSYVILIIALSASALVFISGLLLQISERKFADGKLHELTNRVITTQDEERRRLSRELHDGVSQLLASAKFSLETAEIKIKKEKDPVADIEKSRDVINQTLQDVRRLSRDLHPRVLDDHGLSVGVEALSKNFTERTGIEVKFSQILVRNLLPNDIKMTLYRVAQESFTNIERHSQATQVMIDIGVKGQWIVMSIKDNGLGFDVGAVKKSKSVNEGIGLRNMAERISFYDGEFSILSSSDGTLIEAKIPKSVLRFSNKDNNEKVVV